MICQIVCLVMLFILFNCTMFIRGRLDAQISVARVLVAVICWFLSELGDLPFLYLLICAPYGHELYMCFVVCHVIFPMVYALYFVVSVVTSTSMQTRLRNVSDFRDSIFCLCLLLFCCHVNLLLQRDPCIFWRYSVRMFCGYCCY